MQEGQNCLEKSENLNQENSYKCSKCRDMLFIEMSDGSYGPCECRKIRIAENKLKASGVSEKFREKRFENFDYQRDIQIIESYLTAKSYSNNFAEIRLAKRNSIIICGQVGSGKSHLGISIANNLLDDSVGVIYMPYRSSINNLKQSITDEENYQREINVYKNAEVLLIDDLFKGKITESDVNIMYEIIDYRYFKCLPMIVTTEKTMDLLLNIDEAVGSRIYEMSKGNIVELKGEHLNYRLYGE